MNANAYVDFYCAFSVWQSPGFRVVDGKDSRSVFSTVTHLY
jgi:hypothetical protein